jgi:hypothetical protein
MEYNLNTEKTDQAWREYHRSNGHTESRHAEETPRNIPYYFVKLFIGIIWLQKLLV